MCGYVKNLDTYTFCGVLSRLLSVKLLKNFSLEMHSS